jgi:lipopolysaccharide export system permease protein
MLWLLTLPLIIGATVLSEWVTPAAEIKSGEAEILMRGRSGGERLYSGYWFKEPTRDGSTRIINIGNLLVNGEVTDITLYEFKSGLILSTLSTAKRGQFRGGNLVLHDVTQTHIDDQADQALANAQASARAPVTVLRLPERTLPTTLSAERLMARVLIPERMSTLSLLDYIHYLRNNQLQYDRQVVALWRKLAYPFTLLVMITIAAPVGLIQTRRGGVGAKVFLGILLGVGFFMLNQLALNVGMLGNLPPWLTALGPSMMALTLALGALLYIEYHHTVFRFARQR